ncbi:MAG: hypothetical protein ACFFCV_07170 [Promethearchaeota archaeon]
MKKQGKYKVFSYHVENYLIFYASIKKKKKLIAFAILEDIDFGTTLSILNDFLRKRVIQNYTIQLDTSEKFEKVIFVNIENSNKENIIKAFYSVQKEFTDLNISARFLRDRTLEQKFIDIIFEDINVDTSITKEGDAILVTDEEKAILFNFYRINFTNIEKKKYFLFTFLNLIKNIRRTGFLMFYFTIDYSEKIKFTSYFVEKYEQGKQMDNFEKRVNEFFKSDLVNRINVKTKDFGNIMWRLEITDIYFPLQDFNDMFSKQDQHSSMDVLRMNSIIEKKLSNHHIKHIRLNKNLLFINQSYLLLVLQHLESSIIQKIITTYSSKYFIYVLILSEVDYEKLLEIESIQLLDNVKPLHLKEIHQFNYEVFKKKYSSEIVS